MIRKQVNRILKLENYSTPQIILLVLLIILLVPFLFTLPSFWERLNFENTGQIGDTIGGITAPFINGLSVILVYLALKSQIKANELFREFEQSKMYLDEYYNLRNKSEEIYLSIEFIKENVGLLVSGENYGIGNDPIRLDLQKLTFYFIELEILIKQIGEPFKYGNDTELYFRIKDFYEFQLRYKLDDLMFTINDLMKQDIIKSEYSEPVLRLCSSYDNMWK